ncbi:MAG: hypothetical protein A2046_14120 [Bacteroidetes bacterium GWA2_30_7]|nr:MAG: hypothetical protein A2046_14120 [Bacteroidetes bacterium GWA2_30_7]
MKTLIYTSLLIALFAITTKSQIVYTDVDPDTTIVIPSTVPCDGCDSSHYYYFDLNHDDTLDFYLIAKHYQIYEGGWYDQYLTWLATLNNNKSAWGYHVENDTIGDNLYWQGHTDISQGGAWPLPPCEGYAGLKLIKNNQIYYGWVRMELFNWGIIIKDYAFNSEAELPILGGQITGLENVFDTSNVNIYLNQNILNVDFINNSIYSGTITIYNVSGQQIKNINISGNHNIIDMSNFNTGTYIIKVDNNNSVYSKSIIIE